MRQACPLRNERSRADAHGIDSAMERQHHRTLELIVARPGSAYVRRADIDAPDIGAGGRVAVRDGSRVLVRQL